MRFVLRKVFQFKLIIRHCVIHHEIHTTMAKSKFEYVKHFERDDRCLPNCFLVVRVDGKGFHRFSKEHGFTKPNDVRSLDLMTLSARTVMNEFKEVVMAYGQSDEYSFIFRKNCSLYNRRREKITTNVCSLFASAFVFHWPKCFPDISLKYPPSFDARTVEYPSQKNLRDYLSWRQVDCHINNLYNTVFWALVQKGKLEPHEAEAQLRGTQTSDKNEILFLKFEMNYNAEPQMFRKGTILNRKKMASEVEKGGSKMRDVILTLHCDIVEDSFWEENPHILGSDSTR